MPTCQHQKNAPTSFQKRGEEGAETYSTSKAVVHLSANLVSSLLIDHFFPPTTRTVFIAIHILKLFVLKKNAGFWDKLKEAPQRTILLT